MAENLGLSLVPRRLAEVLEADIIFGRMGPESRVIEEDVAERFGVSRSPVREFPSASRTRWARRSRRTARRAGQRAQSARS